MSIRTDTLGGRCTWLALAMGGLWLLTVVPARHLFGGGGVEATIVSALACLFAGWLTFWLATRLAQPRMQAFGVLLGTIIRGIFALLAAFVMQFVLELPYENYLIWLAIFYLASLGVETALLLGRNSSEKVT